MGAGIREIERKKERNIKKSECNKKKGGRGVKKDRRMYCKRLISLREKQGLYCLMGDDENQLHEFLSFSHDMHARTHTHFPSAGYACHS